MDYLIERVGVGGGLSGRRCLCLSNCIGHTPLPSLEQLLPKGMTHLDLREAGSLDSLLTVADETTTPLSRGKADPDCATVGKILIP